LCMLTKSSSERMRGLQEQLQEDLHGDTEMEQDENSHVEECMR
jgi:hypothetical protein